MFNHQLIPVEMGVSNDDEGPGRSVLQHDKKSDALMVIIEIDISLGDILENGMLEENTASILLALAGPRHCMIRTFAVDTVVSQGSELVFEKSPIIAQLLQTQHVREVGKEATDFLDDGLPPGLPMQHVGLHVPKIGAESETGGKDVELNNGKRCADITRSITTILAWDFQKLASRHRDQTT